MHENRLLMEMYACSDATRCITSMIFASDGMLVVSLSITTSVLLLLLVLPPASPLSIIGGAAANAAKMDLHDVLSGEVRGEGNASFPFNRWIELLLATSYPTTSTMPPVLIRSQLLFTLMRPSLMGGICVLRPVLVMDISPSHMAYLNADLAAEYMNGCRGAAPNRFDRGVRSLGVGMESPLSK